MRTSPPAAYYDRSFIIAHFEFCVNIYFVTQNKFKTETVFTFTSACAKMNAVTKKGIKEGADRLVKNENFRRGTIELAVLAVLHRKDMYGYEIVKSIAKLSDGNYTTPIGTLYPVLYRFTESGFVSDRDEIVNKRLRKYYHLEDAGKQYFQEMLTEYRKIVTGIDLIVNDDFAP